MEKDIFNDIKKENKMTCTKEEFEDYLSKVEANPINISYKFYTFKDKYNGHKIGNPTNNKNAIYYTIDFKGATYLQTHRFDKEGFKAITDSNKQTLVDAHIKQLKTSAQDSDKLQKTIEHFKK